MQVRHAVVLAVLVGAVAGCGAPTVGGQPAAQGSSAAFPSARTFAGPPGTLLFTRAGGSFGDETIFTTRTDTTAEQQVNETGKGCCPRFSPDGAHVLSAASTADGRITTEILPATGGTPRLIIPPDATLNLGPGAWSRDGARLAFEGWDDAAPGRAGIYAGAVEGPLGLRRLTAAPAGYHDIPMDFSPDGRSLLFLRVPTVRDAPVGRLYSVGVGGGAIRAVTPEGTEPAYSARFSPDGQLIVFGTAYWTDPASPVLVIRPDGAGLRAVYTDPGGRAAITPTWSPDGAFLLFGLAQVTGDHHPADQLVVARADGTDLTPLVTSQDFKRLPEWIAS